MKRLVDGVDITVVGRYVVEEYAEGEEGAYGALEREISIENRCFPRENRNSLFRVICRFMLN